MILITGDLHWTDNPRDEYRHQFRKWLWKYIRDHKIDHLVILGDLTESKDEHKAELVNRIVNHIYQLSKVCRITILRGNHDYASDSDNPFFEFLKHLQGEVTWINKPTIQDGFWFLPHTTNYKRDWAGLVLTEPGIIFTHNTFQGADIGGRTIEGIPTDIFGKAKVISGDIHVPQEFDDITYVGAPYTIDFGDVYDPRVLLIRPGTRLSIPVPGPQKTLIEAPWNPDISKIIGDGIWKGDMLKIRIKIKVGDYDRWPEMQEKIRTWASKNDYTIYMIQPILSEKPRMLKARKVDPKSDDNLLRAYAKQNSSVDDQTLKTGLFLSRKV